MPKQNDFDSLSIIYGTSLLEITYQHKIHETTVDKINNIIQNFVNNYINSLKVISFKYFLTKKFEIVSLIPE